MIILEFYALDVQASIACNRQGKHKLLFWLATLVVLIYLDYKYHTLIYWS